ncbi:MAG: CRISPR-associated protein Cas4 [Akkermansiaceae bacterium]|jgi:CRISPR-associated exonuclease Cas4|nr:CRISPR-associated protein Cas4 [Akkermansiaceae bacterium]
MHDEDQYIAISALQHFLYCPRQCALIHLEQAWAENQFTAEGNRMHARAHEGPDETRPGIRITRGMPVVSRSLGLSGQCDVVEFHRAGDVLPIEYKRGKPKAHRADEVQVAAQAMALEEMLGVEIPRALLFYGKTHRRKEVLIDAPLRALCRELATALHEMIRARQTPLAEYDPGKCDACSLIDLCQPKALRFKRGAAAWFDAQLQSHTSPPPP